jgi:hypothetical protein
MRGLLACWRTEKKAGDNLCEVEYKQVRKYDLGDGFRHFYQFRTGRQIAIHGEGPEQRMALVGGCGEIAIVSVESGERIAIIPPAGTQVRSQDGNVVWRPEPRGQVHVAFSSTGRELYVRYGVYLRYSATQIKVYDRQGRYVRGFGQWGGENGEFQNPGGMLCGRRQPCCCRNWEPSISGSSGRWNIFECDWERG